MNKNLPSLLLIHARPCKSAESRRWCGWYQHFIWPNPSLSSRLRISKSCTCARVVSSQSALLKPWRHVLCSRVTFRWSLLARSRQNGILANAGRPVCQCLGMMERERAMFVCWVHNHWGTCWTYECAVRMRCDAALFFEFAANTWIMHMGRHSPWLFLVLCS